MIAKIISTNQNSTSFGAVRYVTEREKKGEAQIMKMKNFPEFLTLNDHPSNFKNYLQTISKQNSRVEKPQIHATISCKEREFSKEELANIAEKWAEKMGYGEQPYLIVFHSDSRNNHVHFVSTRIDANTGKKINDSNERYKSLAAVKEIMKVEYNIDLKSSIKDRILDYKFNSVGQAKTTFEKYGIPYENKDGSLEVKNSIGDKYIFNDDKQDHQENIKRKKQIKALLFKYKDECNTKVFSTIDKKGEREFHSELQSVLHKKLGLEILYHKKDDQKPFGFSIIDHKSGEVFKGSDFMKMNDLLEFTNDEINKTLFDILIKTNVTSEANKKAIANYYQLKEYMLFQEVKDAKPDKRVYSWKSFNNVDDWLKKNDLKLIKFQEDYHILDMKKNILFDSSKIDLEPRKEFKDFCENSLNENQFLSHSFNENEKTVISSSKIIQNAMYVLGTNESSGLNSPDKKRPKKKQKRNR